MSCPKSHFYGNLQTSERNLKRALSCSINQFTDMVFVALENNTLCSLRRLRTPFFKIKTETLLLGAGDYQETVPESLISADAVYYIVHD